MSSVKNNGCPVKIRDLGIFIGVGGGRGDTPRAGAGPTRGSPVGHGRGASVPYGWPLSLPFGLQVYSFAYKISVNFQVIPTIFPVVHFLKYKTDRNGETGTGHFVNRLVQQNA